MADQGPLSGLLARACGAADPAAREAAFDELLRLLMIYIRAGMGSRLRDHRESMDVCQSIAKSFVGEFERGRLVFDSEAALAAYLKRTVRSKLADLARHDGAQKRAGPGRALGTTESGTTTDPAASQPGPRSIVLDGEESRRALAALAEEERTLLRLRMDGMEWEEIGRHLGKDPAALRQQFSRAQRRIAGSLDG